MSAPSQTEVAKGATAPSIQVMANGMRKNGKHWRPQKTAFRPRAGLTSYAKRTEDKKALSAVKVREKEMKEEKEAERQRWIQAIKDKRAAKEEKARFEKMAETMHRKRVERLKRREKRNKLLKP